VDLPPSGRSAAKKKTFVSWRRRESGERRCQSPKPERGAEASTACLICAARSCTSGIDRRSRTEPRVRPETNVERGNQPKAVRVMCSWPACREASHGSIRQAASTHRGAVRSVDRNVLSIESGRPQMSLGRSQGKRLLCWWDRKKMPRARGPPATGFLSGGAKKAEAA
jgi:hypothetical protein